MNSGNISTSSTSHPLSLWKLQASTPSALDSIAVMARWHREQEIVAQDAVPDKWHVIRSGAARKCVIRANGQRHIVDLLLPGDFFGFTTAARHRCAVQAIVEGTTTLWFARRQIEELADTDPNVARLVRENAFATIGRLQDQLTVVGRTRAIEKVCAQLILLSQRLSNARAGEVVLPMSRYDIADYLGISVETVSRAISQLKHKGRISMRGTRSFSFRSNQPE